jgi:hypothetical protein
MAFASGCRVLGSNAAKNAATRSLPFSRRAVASASSEGVSLGARASAGRLQADSAIGAGEYFCIGAETCGPRHRDRTDLTQRCPHRGDEKVVPTVMRRRVPTGIGMGGRAVPPPTRAHGAALCGDAGPKDDRAAQGCASSSR